MENVNNLSESLSAVELRSKDKEILKFVSLDSSGLLQNPNKFRCRSQSPVGNKHHITDSSHSKSLDSVDMSVDELDSANDEKSSIDKSNVSFSHSRELWQKRVELQAEKVSPPKPRNLLPKHTPDLVMDLPLEEISSKKSTKKSNFYSDTSSSEEDTVLLLESPTNLDSPDGSTAAERFAKQNQCTLKKNTKIHHENLINQVNLFDEQKIGENTATSSSHTDTVSTNTSTNTKPQIKAKPQLLKKPVLTYVAP